MRIADNSAYISVRDLIEFVLKQGNLDSSFMSTSRAVLGTKAHKKIQKSMSQNYISEVPLKYTCVYDHLDFVIEGRADGVIENVDLIIIDEIKSTTTPLDIIGEDFNNLHWAQVKCYAFMYAADKNIDEIGAQLTYYHLDTKETKRFLKIFHFGELEQFFKELTDKYIIWINFYINWCSMRDGSLKLASFPFEKYRDGQRELAVQVYKRIINHSNLFVNAPTGIGKTISTLFPTLKAMGEGQVSKIFYVTAKTITRGVAESAVESMQKKGSRIKCITLTAKDKVCFCDTVNCSPIHCPYAEGHFDRVNEAIWDALNTEDLFTRDRIEYYARKHRVCPFEFALDLALWVDIVICDYNYIFDPSVALKRFLEASEYVLLIDEAHNLVDRARNMYSAALSKKKIANVRKPLVRSSPIKKTLGKINNYLLDIKKDYFQNNLLFIKKEAPENLYLLLRQFISLCEKQFHNTAKQQIDTNLLELYFDIHFFLKILDIYDQHYITYSDNESSDIVLNLFCIDPSYVIGDIIAKFKSVILFSATLLPIDYYKYMLGNPDEAAIRIDSPFDNSKSLRLIAKDISTRYNDRTHSYAQISSYIKHIVDNCLGNYLIFFPSYKYLMDVYQFFKEKYPHEYHLHLQSSDMDEAQREAFLEQFEENPIHTHIGFCVLGGIYSEGIDLKYSRLIGVIVVGVGLPQLCLERRLIENYFNEIGKPGYHYAYTYPGINKVVQATGRLIRTDEDYGTMLLIDDRLNTPLYKNLLPPEWFPYHLVTLNSIESLLQ